MRSVFLFLIPICRWKWFDYNIYLQGYDGMLLESIEMGYAE